MRSTGNIRVYTHAKGKKVDQQYLFKHNFLKYVKITHIVNNSVANSHSFKLNRPKGYKKRIPFILL